MTGGAERPDQLGSKSLRLFRPVEHSSQEQVAPWEKPGPKIMALPSVRLS